MQSRPVASPQAAKSSTSRPSQGTGRPEAGHWVLAKLGKRVLRPGGRELTNRLVEAAEPSSADRIVELGPGIGATARLLLEVSPRSYTAVDPEPKVESAMRPLLAGAPDATFVAAGADATGLADGCADLVIGEAMLTMQSPRGKAAIVAEAARLLAPGGRYAVHELAIVPDNAPDVLAESIGRALSQSIHVNARPLRRGEWESLLDEAGLRVTWHGDAPMALLEPRRLIADEGVLGFLKFAFNLLRKPDARRRVLNMRRVFRQNAGHLGAIGLVATKPQA